MTTNPESLNERRFLRLMCLTMTLGGIIGTVSVLVGGMPSTSTDASIMFPLAVVAGISGIVYLRPGKTGHSTEEEENDIS